MGLLLGLALLVAGPGEEVQVAVLAHPVEKGARIEASDFTTEGRAPAAARGALRIEDAEGMEATRRLATGMIVRSTDIMRPQLVRRGEAVSIRIVSGALTIAASGRALSGGAKGESVRVVIASTNRTLDGTIEGSGTVRIAAP